MAVTYSSNGLSFTYLERTAGDAPGESPIESFTRDGSRATRIFDTDTWANRVPSIRCILGDANSNGDGTKVKRYSPMPHPDYVITNSDIGNGQPFLYAMGIEKVEGIGAPTDGVHKGTPTAFPTGSAIAIYRYARLTVLFEITPYLIPPSDGEAADESAWDRYVTLDVRQSGQYLTIPRGCMKFVGGAQAGSPAAIHGVSPGITVPQADIRVTWHSVPYNCVPSILVNKGLAAEDDADTMLGKVNSTAWNSFPAQTLLYTGAAIRAYRHPLGAFYYDIEYNFMYNRNKHNYVPYLSGGSLTWVEITTDGVTAAAGSTGKHIYDGAELRGLFRPPN